MSIQQLLLGLGAEKKTYLDDVFSTYLWAGNATNRTITNGINFSGEGGMVWVKNRTHAEGHRLVDTIRGATKSVEAHVGDAEETQTDGLTAFNNNGFTLGVSDSYNRNSSDVASWSFRKAKGFFDIVQYTGNGAIRQIAHNLGTVPGCIMVKCTSSGSRDWAVYHVGTDHTNPEWYAQELNNTDARDNSTYYWNSTKPTSTNFTVRTDNKVNEDGETYIAYLFAGGGSTATAARSVYSNGLTSYLSVPTHADYDFGTSDFTLECWIRANSLGNVNGFLSKHYGSSSSWRFHCDGSGTSSILKFTYQRSNGAGEQTFTGGTVWKDQWHHVAVARNGTKLRLFVNGQMTEHTMVSDLRDPNTPVDVLIGTEYVGSSHANQYYFDGKISNVRIVKGTAVYTSSFKPPTEPLTSITNTKLLCCQSSTITAATTIATGSITNNNSVTAKAESPFDDPGGFVFGENGNENIVKCGYYAGYGSAGMKVHLGWEPQWVLVKRIDVASQWRLLDSIRGISNGPNANDKELSPTLGGSEADYSGWPLIELSANGFELTTTAAGYNSVNSTYIYTCIRRPDGYCGKPADAGTDVFAMDTGNGSGSIPAFDSNFPVDYAIVRKPDSTDDWDTMPRLMSSGGASYLQTNSTAVESTGASNFPFDSNVGWAINNSSSLQSWMWKRHAGFDVVAYVGDDTAGHQVPHSLSKTPEMIWVKTRNYSGRDWVVYHKGLNGGTNPQNWYMNLNRSNMSQTESVNSWNNTAPTSTHMSLGIGSFVNKDSYNYVAMLFASVDGISKVGSYAGTTSNLTITTGFQPRFVIIRNVTTADAWYVLDTTRGWGSGDDEYLKLDATAAQTSHDFGAPTSTGFTLGYNNAAYNNNGDNFIYYAHS